MLTSLFETTDGARFAAAEALLRTKPPNVGVKLAELVAREHFGKGGKAQALAGERDRNFLISDPAGQDCVLKFYNSAEDTETRSLQHNALRHVHRRENRCPVPSIHQTLEGDDECFVSVDGAECAVAMIDLLPGINPAPADLNTSLRMDVGKVVGLLSRALSDYDHPSSNRTILWDMMLVGELRPLIVLINDAQRRSSLERWLSHFDRHVRPAAVQLPHQIIHNDLSLSNILVDAERRDRVVGIIDFGDIVRAPRINEFAIAASYFMTPDTDFISAMAEILSGASGSLRFTPDEVALMPDLIKARLATRILLSGWRAQLFPDNTSYIMRSNAAAWSLWELLDEQSVIEQSRSLLSLASGVIA